ncbi:MAG: glycosyltransferase, partial [Tannerellaceae bacterium]|nr:glycosyltransferase [Tannerellaceae bacterium]
LIALLSLRKNRKYKLVISERNDPLKRNIFSRTWRRLLYQKADILVCQSKIVKEYYKKCKGVVIPNPLSLEQLEEAYTGKRDKVIVAVGRLMPQKNMELLIESFAKISDRFPMYVLKIYGEGCQRNKLEKKIKNLELQDRISLMGAVQNVTHEYRKSALFVMSSDYEGFPNALIEAMAMGLPVVCTDFATGTAQELVHKENGILVPVGDAHKMSEAIKELLLDEDRREKMGKENVKIREKLAVQKIVQMWEKVIF